MKKSTYKLYKLTALNTLTNKRVVLFSSYLKSEVECEKEHKSDFSHEFKKFKLETEKTFKAPDNKYCIVDKNDFCRYMPDIVSSFTFDLTQEEIINKSLELGFIEINGDIIIVVHFELKLTWQSLNRIIKSPIGKPLKR